jgi:hypothetical protein
VSVWTPVPASPILSGSDGELVSVRVTVDPRALESLLECLSLVSFPVNPEIRHGVPTLVEFPAWGSRLYEVRDALRACGFEQAAIQVVPMLAAIGN